MMPRSTASIHTPDALHEHDVMALVADARKTVLVRRPLHWQVASVLIAALERAWAELDRRAHQAGIEAPQNEARLPPAGPETGASGSTRAADRAEQTISTTSGA